MFYVDANGNGTFNGTVAATNISDARLKKEISPLSSKESLEAITKLRPVSFFWKNPDEHKKGKVRGFLAQEVEAVFPEWVKRTDPSPNDKPLLPEGEKALSLEQFPPDFSPLIISALQELKSENDTLRARLEKLESRLSNVEAEGTAKTSH